MSVTFMTLAQASTHETQHSASKTPPHPHRDKCVFANLIPFLKFSHTTYRRLRRDFKRRQFVVGCVLLAISACPSEQTGRDTVQVQEVINLRALLIYYKPTSIMKETDIFRAKGFKQTASLYFTEATEAITSP